LYAVAVLSGATRPTTVETSTDVTYQNENWNENITTDSGLSTEIVTATEETSDLSANKDQKVADFPIQQSGSVETPNVWRSGQENLMTSQMTSEMTSENFDTRATDDAGPHGITEQLETQSFSYNNGGSSRDDDLMHATAFNYSGHTTHGKYFTEVTSLSWSRNASHNYPDLMGDARSNQPEKFLTYSTKAVSSISSNDGRDRKPSYSTAEQATEAGTDRHQMQLDSDVSSISSREAGGGDGKVSTSAAIVRPKYEGSLGGQLSSREDGQHIMMSPAERRREQQGRDRDSLRNSDDDDDFDRHLYEVRISFHFPDISWIFN